MADIYLEELNKVLARGEDGQSSPAPLCVLATPFLEQLARTTNSTTFKRIEGAFLEPLIHALSEQEEDQRDEYEDEEEPSRKRPRLDDSLNDLIGNACAESTDEGIVAKVILRKAIFKRVFDLASADSTRDANRRKLYTLVKNHGDDDDESDS